MKIKYTKITEKELAEIAAQSHGKVLMLQYRHDSDCPAAHGGERCTCKPELWLGKEATQKRWG